MARLVRTYLVAGPALAALGSPPALGLAADLRRLRLALVHPPGENLLVAVDSAGAHGCAHQQAACRPVLTRGTRGLHRHMFSASWPRRQQVPLQPCCQGERKGLPRGSCWRQTRPACRRREPRSRSRACPSPGCRPPAECSSRHRRSRSCRRGSSSLDRSRPGRLRSSRNRGGSRDSRRYFMGVRPVAGCWERLTRACSTE